MGTQTVSGFALNRSNNSAAAVIGVVLLACVLAVAAARLSGFETGNAPAADPVASIRLGFADSENGAVNIYVWDSGADLQTLAPGEGSFIRGVLRSLVRERRSRGLLIDDPFRLTRYDDGSLTLDDPLTGREIALQAFGPTNADAFAVLLDKGGALR
jgi:putative photosynthetic complex assembly protein